MSAFQHKNLLKFTALERKAVFGLSAIYGLRMFGLFLILPVLAIYADELEGSTPFLVGMTLGAYGIAQAVLQIPFGLLSDRYGRKKIITVGLIIFMVGSLIAAVSDNIYWMIIGRTLQGSGAIAAAVLALTADLTRENQRAKAMAIIGISIGGSFMLAFIAASPLVKLFGFSGLFYVTALLAIFAIFMLWMYVPNQVARPSRDVRFITHDFSVLLRHEHLMRLNIGIFILHCVLTAMFVVVPLLLTDNAGLDSEQHWKIYVPVMILSVALMAPLVVMSSNKQSLMRVFLSAICILMSAQVLFFISKLNNPYSIAICLLVFFVGFNTLEAMLPSIVTRVAPAAMKGTAVGIYNTFQFSGVFVGGLLGGYLMGRGGYQAVFVLCGLLLLLWALVVVFAPRFALYDSYILKLIESEDLTDKELSQRYDILIALDGVRDVIIVDEENVAYLKVDRTEFDEQTLQGLPIVENT